MKKRPTGSMKGPLEDFTLTARRLVHDNRYVSCGYMEGSELSAPYHSPRCDELTRGLAAEFARIRREALTEAAEMAHSRSGEILQPSDYQKGQREMAALIAAALESLRDRD